MHPRYHEWIHHVFDHPVTSPKWHCAGDAPEFVATDLEVLILIAETFSRSGADLAVFSDDQVSQGVWYLVDPACSDFFFPFRNSDLPIETKVAAIKSIYPLYRDCFAARCTQTLGHIDEPGASELNSICYMFWDVCPLSYLPDSEDCKKLEDAIFSVLEDTIRLPHRACIEGGLHGLGELASECAERVSAIIDTFLRTANLDPVLRRYAECASVGGIQ